MFKLQEICIYETTTIANALRVIDQGCMRIAVVVNDDGILLGTLNDGDIRRAILAGYSLIENIQAIYHKNPTVAYESDSKETIIAKAVNNKVYQIPVIDKKRRLVDVIDLATLLSTRSKRNKVILMAGGLGTRLHPLTLETPKPLLRVGSKPILETIIENFRRFGFIEIIISVNYMAEQIKEYFEDGMKFGVSISYIEETKQLGTAGALSMLNTDIQEPFFVMNADLLTNINFENLLDFHIKGNAKATMCVRDFEYQVPYGVIETDGDCIITINEKPLYKFFVNAGIYLLSPDVLQYIPKETYYDMPTLFEYLIAMEKKVLSFPIHEYWLDIGKMVDYEKANSEYRTIFKN